MSNPSASHVRPSFAGRTWRSFGRWRRSRPFWGGLLLLLSGIEIFLSTQLSLGGLSFQLGPTGFLSWLIPTILAACGLLAWSTPQQRMFYAVVGAVTAVFSLIGVNLGGFFLGLVLGIVGAGLVFGWTPLATPPVATTPAGGPLIPAQPGPVDAEPAVDETAGQPVTSDSLIPGLSDPDAPERPSERVGSVPDERSLPDGPGRSGDAAGSFPDGSGDAVASAPDGPERSSGEVRWFPDAGAQPAEPIGSAPAGSGRSDGEVGSFADGSGHSGGSVGSTSDGSGRSSDTVGSTPDASGQSDGEVRWFPDGAGGSTDPTGWVPGEPARSTEPAGLASDLPGRSSESAGLVSHGPGRSADGHGAEAGVPAQSGGDPGSAKDAPAEDPQVLPRRESPRFYTVIGFLIVLGMTAVFGLRTSTPAYAAPCPKAPPVTASKPAGEKPAVPVVPPAATPTPTPDAGGSEGDDPGIIGRIVDGITGLFDGDSAKDTATKEGAADPTPAPATIAKPAPSKNSTATTKPKPKPGCARSSGSAPSDEEQPTLALLGDEGLPDVNRSPSVLTGSKLTMWDLTIAGIATLHTSSGDIQALKFTMSRSRVDDFALRVPQGEGRPLLIKSDPLVVRGDVAFYATRFVGRFLGVKLTLTPESPIPPDGIPLTVPKIEFTDPNIQLAYVACDTLEAPTLDESFPPAST
ncbi:hypothetical protein DFJ67_2497 [Asanoa ferruginea]|uniref:Uncharacterized protein n=1 Tax=Asanoa ferruginea TaxID=53367 RepID=A0A3D9ZGW4_9ACTN|nr:DUF6114 domain-containing protein [Asanoa ferruginea]REF96515.1 hypothetical protein DFJ67_2497 [Asanoa ferruginea]GIF53221.1 hypothetical protein Afe04nite_77600 [Asanoa ferruginea]